MPLPETILVKYTEEDAEFVSVRPVIRQSFRMDELLDMILSVTGKDLARIQKVLQSGTVVFHFYRYRWEGFAAAEKELAAALSHFPDAEPERPFAAEHCAAVLVDTGSQVPPEWTKQSAMRRRFFRRRNLWSVLLEIAARGPAKYLAYSYDRKADVYAVPVDAALRRELTESARKLLPSARVPLASLSKAHRLLYLCVRS